MDIRAILDEYRAGRAAAQQWRSEHPDGAPPTYEIMHGTGDAYRRGFVRQWRTYTM
jgi:hypothetical protein